MLVLLAALCMVPAARADVELRTYKNISLEATPIDVVMSPSGQMTFVLTDSGEVLIYTISGDLQERIKLDEPADNIATTPRGDAIIVSSRKNKTLKIILLEIIKEISIGDSPFKGPAEAPVTVVVFSDFQ